MRTIRRYDAEYTANWYPEVRYLTERRIRYTFTKDVVDEVSGETFTIWKYEKNKKLFDALSDFYDGL